MKFSKQLLSFTTITFLAAASADARSAKDYFDIFDNGQDAADLQKMSQIVDLAPLREFYSKLSKQHPKCDVEQNVEEDYRIKVTPENAAEVLALALLVGAEAPHAHKLFTEYYDPWARRSDTGELLLPDTEEVADKRADLIIGMQQQWPTLIEAIKIKRAVRKASNDSVQHSPYSDGVKVRVRPNMGNLTQDFYQAQLSSAPQAADTSSGATRKRKRPFVERKEAWRAKHSTPWSGLNKGIRTNHSQLHDKGNKNTSTQ